MVSGGVIVVAAVVGALALFETVLPRAFAALRKWRRQAKGRTQLPSANANLAKTDVATTLPSVATPQSVFAKVDAKNDGRGTSEEARQLWEEARGMMHRFTPDEIKDSEYLRKIQRAAELGHLEAMAKMGTYAFRRRRYVEAFYWRWRAEANGWRGTEKPTLREIRSEWQLRGCPTEYDNDLGEERGKFARAVLRLQCGIDAAGARRRLKRLADRGVEEARLFLGI